MNFLKTLPGVTIDASCASGTSIRIVLHIGDTKNAMNMTVPTPVPAMTLKGLHTLSDTQLAELVESATRYSESLEARLQLTCTLSAAAAAGYYATGPATPEPVRKLADGMYEVIVGNYSFISDSPTL